MLVAISAIWGDAITVAGFVLTGIALIATLVQVRKAKSAAEAARDAAQAALAESRREYVRFTAANTQRYINEVIIYLEQRAWSHAALRLGDLADHVAQLASDEVRLKPLVDELRSWSITIQRLGLEESKKKFAATKWALFLVRLRAELDKYQGPFALKDRERADETRTEDP